MRHTTASLLVALLASAAAARLWGIDRLLLTPRVPVPGEGGAVLVTGASSGIGEHAAAALLAQTPLAVFAGVRKKRDATRLEKVYPGMRTVLLDVTSHESIAAAVQLISASEGVALVALVNNAGVQADLPVELQNPQDDRWTFNVNVFGLLDVTRAFLPLLRAAPGGGARVVNVGSVSGVVAAPGSATYSASKFAVEGLTDSLRRELAPLGVSVSLLQPGYVRSKMGSKAHAASPKKYGVSAADYDTYRHVFEGFFEEDRVMSLPENADPPDISTTPAILDAIMSPRPLARYPVAWAAGFPAGVITWAAGVLPDRIMDLLT